MPIGLLGGLLIGSGIQAGTSLIGAKTASNTANRVSKDQANAATQAGALTAAAAADANRYAMAARDRSSARLTMAPPPMARAATSDGFLPPQAGQGGAPPWSLGSTAPSGAGQGTVRLKAPDGTVSDIPAQLAGHYLARGATRVG